MSIMSSASCAFGLEPSYSFCYSLLLPFPAAYSLLPPHSPVIAPVSVRLEGEPILSKLLDRGKSASNVVNLLVDLES